LQQSNGAEHADSRAPATAGVPCPSMPAPAQRLAGSTRLAGVNAIFYGERLLTTPNPAADRDLRLLARLGMTTAAAAPD